MGGYGSGRRGGFTAYGLTSDHLSLDIRKIKREGCSKRGHTFSWYWRWRNGKENDIQLTVNDKSLTLSYRIRTNGGEWLPFEYDVKTTQTSCHFGGTRNWFVCPGKGCEKRVAILYVGKHFLCRQCAGLVYESQRKTDLIRTTRRMDKIRDRLNWTPGFLNGPEWKPKGMHWRTFRKYDSEYKQLYRQCTALMISKFGISYF